jgi:hypothetical protein
MNNAAITTIIISVELLQFTMLGGLLALLLFVRDELTKIRERLATIESVHERDRNDKAARAFGGTTS